MGYKLAGYEVIGNVEIDPEMNNLYIQNQKPKYNYLMGVQDFKRIQNTDLPDELFGIDILDGSPPCSTFSLAGKREKKWGKKAKFREGQAVQILDDLFFDFLDVVEKLNPKVVIAENVKGMLAGNAKGYVHLIIQRLAELGYKTQIFLLNAAAMGVPQKRERVFFIAHKDHFNFPKLKLEFKDRPILYKEYKDSNFKPLKRTSLTYRRWLKRLPTDIRMSDTVQRTENKNTQFTNPYWHENKVLPTLTSNGSMYRFDVPGKPSDKDIRTTQTFPQDYQFFKANVQYVCGMSVPPIMMKKIAKEVYVQWFQTC